MSKYIRNRPYHVGPHRHTEFHDRFRYSQGLIKRVYLEVFDQELNRFILVPALAGSTIQVPPEDNSKF